MPDHATFLQTLSLVIGTAAITTFLFQKLKQPVVLGYLLAGMIVGPYLPIPVLADADIVRTLAELGVIMLLFYLGLEFSLRKLIKVFPTVGFIALLQCSFMMWIGYVTGRLFDWTVLQSLYAGAVVCISSTTIIVKAFGEQKVQGKLAHIVFGILIVEDLIAILLLAVFNTLGTGKEFTALGFLYTTGALLIFLTTVLVVGILTVPRLIRTVIRMNRPETTLVTAIGICFGLSFLAYAMGYSVALGAFIAGALVSESGESETVAKLVSPVKDLFVAIFFVAVGMMINPVSIIAHWDVILVFFFIVIVGQVLSVTIGTFLMGHDMRLSIKVGMCLAQIGEFSFIIAGLGLTTRSSGELVYTMAVAVSAMTTLTTPWLIAVSDSVAMRIDRYIPRSIQTFMSLYTTWVGQIRQSFAKKKTGSRLERLGVLLAIDVFFCASLIIMASIFWDSINSKFSAQLTLSHEVISTLILIAIAISVLPFVIGIIRCARELGTALAYIIMPQVQKNHPDLANAPRRTLVVTVELVIIMVAGLFLLVVTQPFLPIGYNALIFSFFLVVTMIIFWRSTDNLQGHVKAGAQMVVEALSSGVRDKSTEMAHDWLPGLGPLMTVKLESLSPAVGRTLKAIHLRALTGANVVAIVRPSGSLAVPTGDEMLQCGDVIAMTGDVESVGEAKKILMGS